ncbi:MAG TPA: protein translocase subunit SecF [Abditibacteriaceae bacterium]|jgi:preprotein translocase subunit SecF
MDFRGKHIDLVGKLNLWFGISLALIVVGMFSWLAFGLNLGIDFKGGGQFQYRIPYSQRPKAGEDVRLLDEARRLLEQKGFSNPKPQIAGGNTLVINTQATDQSELAGQQRRILEALGPRFTGQDANNRPQELLGLSQEFVGPVIGRELKRAALTGVIVGVLLIALWIYIRYNFAGGGARYAVAGIVALVHDVLVLVGIFALIGHFDERIEIDGSFIAALLTVVGYSINDSVVIFDRLRENLRNRRKEPFDKVVNDSLLETMSRSINTGLTVIIMLFVLLFFGGESIYNFVLAMLIGIASGLYSSIFNASMVLVAWNRWDEKKQRQARSVRGTATPARTVTATASTRGATSSAGTALSTPPRRTTFASTAQPTASTVTPTASAATASAAAPSTAPATPAVTHSAVTQPLTDTGSVTGPPIEVVPQTEPARATVSTDVGDGASDSGLNGGAYGADASDADAATLQSSTERGGPSRPAPMRKSRAKRRF